MSRIAISMLTVLAGAATPAFAQPENEAPARVLKGDPKKPLGEGRGEGREAPGGFGNVTMSFTQSDGHDTIKVKVVDGEIAAEVNGKAVPADRIRQSDGKIEILGANGEVEHTINVNLGGFGAFGAPAAPRAPQPPRRAIRNQLKAAPGDGGIAITRIEAPKVMMGITMSTADDTTLKRLGLDKQAGVFVDSVFEGLPAAKAGLEANDLITEADGKTELSEAGLRDILKTKNPGDKLKVKVLRKGETKEFTVNLEAYSGEKLELPLMGGDGDRIEIQGIPRGLQLFGGPGAMGFDDEKLRELLEESLTQLKGDAKDWEKIKTQVIDQLEEALGQLKQHDIHIERFGDHFKELFGEGRPFVEMRNGKAFVKPLPDAAPAPAAEAQLDRIADQLERLNRRLDDLEKKLAEKK